MAKATTKPQGAAAKTAAEPITGFLATVARLSRQVQSWYKSAPAGGQEPYLWARLEKESPEPAPAAIAWALGVSHLPRPLAVRLVMRWDSEHGPKANAAELGKALKEELAKSPTDALRAQLAAASKGPQPATTAPEPKAEAAGEELPKTREECPAYVRKAFEEADPDDIAGATGEAIFKAMPIWSPANVGRRFIDSSLFKAAGIPLEWETRIGMAYGDCVNAAEERAHTAEAERRRALKPKAAEPEPEPAGIESDPVDWIRVSRGEAKDIEAQASIVLGLVDGVTARLEERDPEDREARKLSALRGQVDNLIDLLNPIMTGEGGRA